MELFATIALSWPTAVFSVLLMVVIAYWLLAMLGLVDLDILHFHVHPDGEAVHFESLAGLLLKYGLEGVPITLVFTCVVSYAWIISYFGDYYLLRPMPADALRYLFGTGVLAIALVLAVPLAGLSLRPLRSLFAKVKPVTSESLLGKVAIVRSPEVTLGQGTAALEDGGAGLILQIRAEPGQFKRGDSVVLVEYLDAANAYRVIREGG